MEHNTLSDKPNQAKYLTDNIDHSFTWKVICNIPDRKLARKLIEAYFTATMKPSVNDCYTFLETVLHNFDNCIYFQWDHYFNL